MKTNKQIITRRRGGRTKHGAADGHRLRIGFDGGTDFYSVPVAVIFLGAMIAWYEIFPSEEAVNRIHWVWAAGLIAVGAALYAVQHRKLEFRKLCMPPDLEKFRAQVREIMREDGWKIIEDDERCIQAIEARDDTIRFYDDKVTLQFWGGTVRYNVINDPEAYKSGIACLISPCRHGRRLIGEIRDLTDNAANAGGERNTPMRGRGPSLRA